MADDPTAPSLNLTAEEKRVFGQLFQQADTEGVGVVTGEVAVKFFEKTRLEPRILGEIWQIADKENRGFLTPAGFGIVLRLIGHYQAGRDPTPDLALRPGPLPKFDGGSVPGMSPTNQPPPGPPPSTLQQQASGPIRVPPLTPDKAAQYAALFEKSGAQNGILPGEQAKNIFERAGLPNEILGRIWNLADTEQRGALQATEFVIAMHLLASFKSGAMRALPNVLPAGLYEAAARRPPSRQASGISGMSTIPRQFSGAGPARTASPLNRPTYSTTPTQYPQSTGASANSEWAISLADKLKFDSIYSTLDKTNKGFITGDEAVPFFSESKLPEEALAQIWDLADINSAGRLSRDEFAVAMYLIRQQRSKRDGRDTLPGTLPQNLVPLSMRNQVRPAAVPTAPAFENPAPTLPKSAAEDLFGLDALASPSAPAQAPQSTGGSNSFGVNRQSSNDFFGGAAPMTPASPSEPSPQHSTIFKSFTPSSSFGQALTHNATGGSITSQPKALQQQRTPANEDLLGDNDPEISKRLTNETAELANLSNQVGSLSKQMQEVQGQRVTTQNELNQASSQKFQFEQRLAQLRALYEQEVKDVRSFEERLVASRNETKKLRTELAMIEGTYQDLQVQTQQMSAALQADQQENASLKERMRVINAEVAAFKPALEKLRSDARQQKGLVAINRKQLATNEGERDKLKAEAAELNKSIEVDTLALAAATKVPSPPPQAASPTPSTMSANNPFFRRQGSASDATHSPFPASPIAGPQNDRSFENVFGPAFGAATAAHESTPPSQFRRDSDGRSASAALPSTLPIRQQTAGGSAFPTPSASPPANNRDVSQPIEPPPPSESRQISSSFLPFAADHDGSLSSSRQVSAPNSRFGEGSTGADTPTNYLGNTPTGSSAAGQTENHQADSPTHDRNSDASPALPDAKDTVPGAFPGDPNSNIVATPTGGSTLSEQADADPFGKEAVRTGNAKDDFDAAFAGFGSSAKPQERSNTGNSSAEGSMGAVPANFHKEFPPIAELEHDDDSDSASERGGFEDDFAPASPSHSRKISSSQVPALEQPRSSSAANDFLGTRPTAMQNLSARSLGTSPPTPGAQAPPPPYDKAVSPSEKARAEIKPFEGLLPSRDVPSSATSPPVEHASNSKTPFGAPSGSSKPEPLSKVPFDDDFDDFDNLEDAKEGDADDDFANISVHDRSGLEDFNPMFDSVPSSKSNELTSHASSGFGSDSFGEFTSSPRQATQPAPASAPAPAPTAVNNNHDWDAIFAGLDASTPTVGSSSSPPVTKTEASKPAAAGKESTTVTKDRPELGRALTEAGVHDDPILKNLTGMGYPRTEALAALEKYDYNLERAANYLASQS